MHLFFLMCFCIDSPFAFLDTYFIIMGNRKTELHNKILASKCHTASLGDQQDVDAEAEAEAEREREREKRSLLAWLQQKTRTRAGPSSALTCILLMAQGERHGLTSAASLLPLISQSRSSFPNRKLTRQLSMDSDHVTRCCMGLCSQFF